MLFTLVHYLGGTLLLSASGDGVYTVHGDTGGMAQLIYNL